MTGAQSIICVPVEDGAIQRAFDHLDAQMDAWLAAMRRIDVGGRAQPVESPAPSPVERPVERMDPADAVQPACEAPAVAQMSAFVQSPSRVAEVETPEPECLAEMEAPEPECVADRQIEAPAPVVATPSRPVEAGPPPAVPAPAQCSELDDDVLLATLDEETARDIRVMRRLSVGRRSVRELLAEYQAKHAGQPVGETAKKSWWRRGK